MCCRLAFVALSVVVAFAVSSQVSAQQQQAYPPAGYQPQPYPQQPAQPYPQQQAPLPPQEPGYYPPQQPVAPGYGFPGNAPNPAAYPAGYAPPPAPLVSSVNGAIQIGAGIGLVGFDSTSLSPSAPKAIPTTPSMGMEPAITPPTLITTCCVLKNPLLIEAGYGLSDQLLLGAQLQLLSGSESTSDPTQDLKQFAFSFGPKLDYHFMPTSRWNPFIGAVVNITLESKSFYMTKDSRTIFGVMARGGVRYFVLDQLSIDPTLAIGGHFGSGTQTPGQAPQAKIDYSLSGFQFAVSLGLSLWVK